MNPVKANFNAALWMAGTLCSFSLLAVAARELSQFLSTAEILFYRGILGLLIISTIVSVAGWRRTLAGSDRRETLAIHAIRNLSHFVGQFTWFYAIALIPLAEVFALEFTVPFWTLIIASLLLGERFTAAKLLAVSLGIAGTLIIVQPGFTTVDSTVVILLAGAASYGLSHTLTKKLTLTTTPLAILFYMNVMQLPMSFGLLMLSPADVRLPVAAQLPWLFIVGITSLSAHYCMSKAFSHADATIVVPMDFLRLPLIAAVGALLYGETISSAVMLGAMLMLLGNMVNILGERRKTTA